MISHTNYKILVCVQSRLDDLFQSQPSSRHCFKASSDALAFSMPSYFLLGGHEFLVQSPHTDIGCGYPGLGLTWCIRKNDCDTIVSVVGFQE